MLPKSHRWLELSKQCLVECRELKVGACNEMDRLKFLPTTESNFLPFNSSKDKDKRNEVFQVSVVPCLAFHPTRLLGGGRAIGIGDAREQQNCCLMILSSFHPFFGGTFAAA